MFSLKTTGLVHGLIFQTSFEICFSAPEFKNNILAQISDISAVS